MMPDSFFLVILAKEITCSIKRLEKKVCVEFAREAPLSGYVEESNCETWDYKESVDRAMVCKKF